MRAYFNFYRISESCKIIEFTKIIDLFNIRIHDKNIKYFNKYESIGAEFNFISNKNYTKSFGPHKFNLNYLIKNIFLFKKTYFMENSVTDKKKVREKEFSLAGSSP